MTLLLPVPEPLGPTVRLLVAGDWHGEIGWIGTCAKLARRHGCAGILQTGDFGLWPMRRRGYRDSGGGPINLKALGLTRTQWDNFQKLRYFGLVEQVAVSGKRQAGVWKITQLGLAFLAGKVVVPKFAWTFRGDVVRTEGPYITITEVKGGFQPRSVWAAEAEPADLPESDAA